MANTNDFIINITGEINETETRRRIQEALARIVPNAFPTIHIAIWMKTLLITLKFAAK